MTAYNSALYNAKTPPNGGHGFNQITAHMHAAASLPAAAALNDSVNFFSLPANAVVVGLNLKAQTQLDSNGSPTLTFDVGVAGTTNLFMAASALVGRVAGASFDATMPGVGKLYKNTSGKDVPVFATVHAAAATGVAGVLELEMSYFVEDSVGSQA